MRSEATIRMRSPTSYISRTLPLASSGRESSVAASLIASEGSTEGRRQAAADDPRSPQLAGYAGVVAAGGCATGAAGAGSIHIRIETTRTQMRNTARNAQEIGGIRSPITSTKLT